MSLSPGEFTTARAYLLSHSADILPHPGGSLMQHLEGTCQLLHGWNCAPEICLAGLCHAVYGTDGWPSPMEDPARREKLSGLIGPEAEQLVYFYASCDRGWLYPQLAPGALVGIHDLEQAIERQQQGIVPGPARDEITFRDRFTGQVNVPPPQLFAAFLVLTFANELEIIRGQWPHVCEQNRVTWQAIFESCRDQVGEAVYDCYRETYHLGRRPAAA